MSVYAEAGKSKRKEEGKRMEGDDGNGIYFLGTALFCEHLRQIRFTRFFLSLCGEM